MVEEEGIGEEAEAAIGIRGACGIKIFYGIKVKCGRMVCRHEVSGILSRGFQKVLKHLS